MSTPRRERTKIKPTSPSTSNPYPRTKIRIPREIKSSAELWLDFFQQFCDLTISDSPGIAGDSEAIGRARILADRALTVFQERFPGVYPNQ